MRSWTDVQIALTLLTASVHTVAPQDGVSTLQGGASSLQETYGDCRVFCSATGQTKRRVLSQQQSQQDGRRVLAVEFVPMEATGASRTLIMPFVSSSRARGGCA